jgi:hypothetical protein
MVRRRSFCMRLYVSSFLVFLKYGIDASEQADCRLFYEPEMLRDARAIWKKAASVAWGSGKCIAGSLPHKQETHWMRKRKAKETRMKVRSARMPREFKPPSQILEWMKRPVFGKKVPL